MSQTKINSGFVGTGAVNVTSLAGVALQLISGYQEISMASGDVALALSDVSEATGRNMTIKFTGTLGANRTVTFPASTEKFFNIIDGTNHAGYTLTFKVVSQTGIQLCEGHHYICHSNGTDIVKDQETKVWRAITAAETVQAGAQILVDTSGGSVTVTLPASPSTGDEVSFSDQKLSFDNNSLVVGRNSSNIAGSGSNLTVSTEGAGFTLVYSGDATAGWVYKEK